MKPDIVVDVGNSRIKWGRCAKDDLKDIVSLFDDPAAWEKQIKIWELTSGHLKGLPLRWAVAGVHPERRDCLVEWLQQRGDAVLVLSNHHQLPILVQLKHSENLGIDRLLNAVAARSRVLQLPSVIIDAGTAVTVDWVDATHTFRGGAIFPGFRLMAQALHDHTAALPLVKIVPGSVRSPPGQNTEAAIQAGVFWAVAGGVRALIRQLAGHARVYRYKVFLTGGNAELLAPVMESDVILWPEMTLEGIRLTAEAQP